MARKCLPGFLVLCLVSQLLGQSPEPPKQAPEGNAAVQTLHTTSRAVLLDVIVTDSHGDPVKGLDRDAFTVKEQGKPQKVSFFEENGIKPPAQPVEMPKLPPDVFSNFSPFPQPPAVNVLLVDFAEHADGEPELCTRSSAEIPEECKAGHAECDLHHGTGAALHSGIQRRSGGAGCGAQ